MIRSTHTLVRPDKSILFYDEIEEASTEYKSYIYNNFIKNKRMIKSEKTLSEDGLTLTTTMLWDNEDSFLDLCTDEFLFNDRIHKVNVYNVTNGIQSDVFVTKVE